MLTLTFFYDPGHGWLAVEQNDLDLVNLRPTDFSRYSYRLGNVYYLEEDCDAPRFIAAAEATGIALKIIENGNGAFVRNLPHIHNHARAFA